MGEPKKRRPCPVPAALRTAAEGAVRDIPGVEAAVLFGSRARDDWREDSDWDLALVTNGDLGREAEQAACRRLRVAGLHVEAQALPAEWLRREADAFGRIAYPIVREGHVIAGTWTRPAAGGETAMEPEIYRTFIDNALRFLRDAIDELARLPSGRPGLDRAGSRKVIAASADAAEHLVKAMRGRVAGDGGWGHNLADLARPLSDAGRTDLHAAVLALNGDSADGHQAAYGAAARRPPRPDDARRAAERLAGTARLLVVELGEAAADDSFGPEAVAAAEEAADLFSEAAALLHAAEALGSAPAGEALVDAAAAGRSVLLAALEGSAAALGCIGDGAEMEQA